MPGIVAGVTTAFAWTFSAFATPQLIGGGQVNMVSNLVYQLGFASFNFPFAASLSVAGLALTFVVFALLRVRRGRSKQSGRIDAPCGPGFPGPARRAGGQHDPLLPAAARPLVVTIAAFNAKRNPVISAAVVVLAMVRQGHRL
jgi:ABC-type Fe3+ transport system permease subunit